MQQLLVGGDEITATRFYGAGKMKGIRRLDPLLYNAARPLPYTDGVGMVNIQSGVFEEFVN